MWFDCNDSPLQLTCLGKMWSLFVRTSHKLSSVMNVARVVARNNECHKVANDDEHGTVISMCPKIKWVFIWRFRWRERAAAGAQ